MRSDSFGLGRCSLLNVIPLSVGPILQNFFCFDGADVDYVVVNLVRIWKTKAVIDAVLNASLGKLGDLVAPIINCVSIIQDLLQIQIIEIVANLTRVSEVLI